ncbi:MAG: hypothetical protein ACOH10_01270 [Rhodoglobus sp.]
MNLLNERATRLAARKQVKRRKTMGVAAAITAFAFLSVGATAAWAGNGDYGNGGKTNWGSRDSSASQSDHRGRGHDGRSDRKRSGSRDQASTPTPSPTETPIAIPADDVTSIPVEPVSPPVALPVTPAPAPAPAPVVPVSTSYPLHTNVVATSFWVGEIFDASLPDGSQMFSTYDAKWFANYGGCDGVASSGECSTEKRTAANGYFPTSMTPKQNPFYLDLPFDDLNDKAGFAQRCTTIPWALADNAATGVNHCGDQNYSYMKNSWVQLTGPNGATCYGQVQDAGPSSGSLYHDANYVFGKNDARPENKKFSGDSSQGAGMDVSPALNGCLGFASLDGDSDHVDWRFIDEADVPAGPWLKTVTTSQVTN